jgi:oxygen-independent coproporphyrinogen-3 oxidase
MILTETQWQLFRQLAPLNLPRHTSYPSAAYWQEASFDQHWLSDFGASPSDTWSVYLHIPFCRQLCSYCGCTKMIVPNRMRAHHDPSPSWLTGFEQELQQTPSPWKDRPVAQLHLGGGTPTFLSPEQLDSTFTLLKQHFRFKPEGEFAVEIDPRVTTLEHLEVMKSHGINRLSLGIQDFSETVQTAVNRIQPYDLVEAIVQQIRDLGFNGINFDLIYGLPFQTMQSMAKTLAMVIALKPDRIAYYRMAMIPDLFKHQQAFQEKDMPDHTLTTQFMALAWSQFLSAGYQFIGLDHFALPHDPLAVAAQNGTLTRNFQGMSTGKHLPILGYGPSSISSSEVGYYQRPKSLDAWLNSLAAKESKFPRGHRLSAEEQKRRDLIYDIYGPGTVNLQAFEIDAQGPLNLSWERQSLSVLEKAGLIRFDGQSMTLEEPLGRFLARAVASIFDSYVDRESLLAALQGLAPQGPTGQDPTGPGSNRVRFSTTG